MRIKGFIFDCDGTLVESMKYWDMMYIEFLKKFDKIADEKTLIELEPMFLSDGIKYMIDKFNLGIDYIKGAEIVDEIVFDMYANKVEFKPHALEFLNNYPHIKKCVLSTTDKKYLDFFFENKNLIHKFEFISCASEFGYTKHYIEPYEMAACKMGLKKDEVIVFEDASYAIKTLVKHDYYVVGIKDDMAKDVQFIKQNVNQYICDFSEFKMPMD